MSHALPSPPALSLPATHAWLALYWHLAGSFETNILSLSFVEDIPTHTKRTNEPKATHETLLLPYYHFPTATTKQDKTRQNKTDKRKVQLSQSLPTSTRINQLATAQTSSSTTGNKIIIPTTTLLLLSTSLHCPPSFHLPPSKIETLPIRRSPHLFLPRPKTTTFPNTTTISIDDDRFNAFTIPFPQHHLFGLFRLFLFSEIPEVLSCLSSSPVSVWQVTPQYSSDSAERHPAQGLPLPIHKHPLLATVTIDYTFPSLGDASSRSISPDINSCCYPFVFSQRLPVIGLDSTTIRHLTATCIYHDVTTFL
ncbi:hypothetical protein VTL71DRAFT_10592 [Oculimacula yallundae]|uniref:Uncharacterized protein n=1 Tax=Oculimacula yallundae TaxID=86028 RepID=A0ABR4CV72_9HELO